MCTKVSGRTINGTDGGDSYTLTERYSSATLWTTSFMGLERRSTATVPYKKVTGMRPSSRATNSQRLLRNPGYTKNRRASSKVSDTKLRLWDYLN